jgi:FlaA1/EpsC-like NDP-sugar epimerase
MTPLPFQGKTVVITGGTGSLGKTLTRRLLAGTHGQPKKVLIFSRDEAKQHFMRVEFQHRAQQEEVYRGFQELLEFRIGDVRDYHSVCRALRGADVVVNAAALKQVPSCEYAPYEAVQTNILGAENIVRAIRDADLGVETVVGVSTDKACKPVNVMGMTKAIQERVFIGANLGAARTRFVCLRYGNVLASRGSVIPLFHEQVRRGGPITITTEQMTRFLMPLERALDTVCAAISHARPGEIFVPKIPAGKITDVAKAMIGDRGIKIVVTGIRPGEKIHEVLVSEEEATRTIPDGDYYVITPSLPELTSNARPGTPLGQEYSSGESLLPLDQIRKLLVRYGLTPEQTMPEDEGELLR